MFAQNFNFTPKSPPPENGGFSVPNIVYLGNSFSTRRSFVGSLKGQLKGAVASSACACHDANGEGKWKFEPQLQNMPHD